jgi:RNA polymerase sigma-70 factor (ECF subfamily)
MAAVQQTIEAHIPSLRRYARALVRDVAGADDLVQECLTRALLKVHLWHEGSDLRAWLFTILHNQHVNQIRRSIRMGTTVELDQAAPLASRPADQEKRLELRDLDRALGRLPAEQRAVILLVGLEGMPYSAAGAILGIPTGTVRSRLSRGRLTLRRLMGVEPDEGARPTVSYIRALRPQIPSPSAEAAWSESSATAG